MGPVGKFYELFNMDSLIGIEELNLIPMGGSRLHTGFPEKSMQKYRDILCERGYRVARVEQTESNVARNERVRSGSREKNVVHREVCQITTPGTSREVSDATTCAPKLLMSLCQERQEREWQRSECEGERQAFGVCFVDTTIGRFTLGQFTDDRSLSRLRSLLAHYPPVELLVEKSGLSPDVTSLLSTWLPSAVVRPLLRDKQFYSASQTLKLVQEARYFEQRLPSGEAGLPDVLRQMLHPDDCLQQTARPEYSLAVKALGGGQRERERQSRE